MLSVVEAKGQSKNERNHQIINQRTVSTPLPNSGEWSGNVTKQSLAEQKRTVNLIEP